MKAYHTIRSMPGLKDPVMVELRVTRHNIWLLERVIALGLNGTEEGAASVLLELLTPEVEEELQALAAEGLQKAGLTVLSE